MNQPTPFPGTEQATIRDRDALRMLDAIDDVIAACPPVVVVAPAAPPYSARALPSVMARARRTRDALVLALSRVDAAAVAVDGYLDLDCALQDDDGQPGDDSLLGLLERCERLAAQIGERAECLRRVVGD